MSKDTSGQAFPVPDIGAHGQYGMTHRQYLAAEAMKEFMRHTLTNSLMYGWRDHIATNAYLMADAMLAHEAKEAAA